MSKSNRQVDRNMLAALAALVSTLDEVGESPEGILYAGLMASGITLDEYQRLADALVADDWCERRPGPKLAIKPKGREAARQLNAGLR